MKKWWYEKANSTAEFTFKPSSLENSLDLSFETEWAIFKRMKYSSLWVLKNKESHSYAQEFFFDDKNEAYIRYVTINYFDESSVIIKIKDCVTYKDFFLNESATSTLIDSMEDVILITQSEPMELPEPRVLYVNPSFEKMTGYTFDEIVGKSPRLLQGTETKTHATKMIRKSLNEWNPIRIVLDNYKKCGEKFQVELNISPVKDKTGWWTHWVSIQRDVTAQTYLKEKLFQRDIILEQNNIGLWTFDGQKLIPNENAKLMISNTKEFCKVVEIERFVFSEKNKVNRKISLGDKIFEVHMVKHLDKIHGLIRDVTEIMMHEKQIAEQKMLDAHLSKLASIGQLASGVAHEINNPLMIASGYLDKIKTNQSDELKKIKEALSRIQGIVKGLKSHAVEDGNHLDVVDFSYVLKESISFVEELYKNKEIQINATIEDNVRVYANHGKLQQVIMNLMDNAKDALEKKVIKNIIIKLEKDDSFCYMSIEDNAGGIPESCITKIFEPFYTTKALGKGIGIGLGIVHSIVQEFKGSITVTNTEQGAKFVVKIPITQEKTSEFFKKEAVERKEFNYKVLCVDDEPLLLSLLEMMCEDLGCSVVKSESAEEALNQLTKHQFDIIISDINMPRMNGIEFLRELKKKGETTPFAFSTGGVNLVSGESELSELSNDILGFLEKPYEEDSLIELFNKI